MRNKSPEELTKTQRGRMRFERIVEADANGKLEKAKNRVDVCKIANLGLENEERLYAWVTKLINQGIIQEEFLGKNKRGRREYRYSIDRKIRDLKSAPSVVRQPIKESNSIDRTILLTVESKGVKVSLSCANSSQAMDIVKSLI